MPVSSKVLYFDVYRKIVPNKLWIAFSAVRTNWTVETNGVLLLTFSFTS